jgi:hypothetical protein
LKALLRVRVRVRVRGSSEAAFIALPIYFFSVFFIEREKLITNIHILLRFEDYLAAKNPYIVE